jgi:hypothetical protein
MLWGWEVKGLAGDRVHKQALAVGLILVAVG